MYKIKINAMSCDKRFRDFIAAGCGEDIQHIGVKTVFYVTTKAKPTSEYLHALEKHIESFPPTDNGKGMIVYYVDVKAELIRR